MPPAPSRTPAPAPARRRLLPWTVVRGLAISLGTLLVLELAARVGAYALNDFNPYYLLRGLRSWSDAEGRGHSDRRRGYDKFPPSRTMLYGTPEPARINNHGFRGPDFEAEKPAGVLRVICLGGSSTFGYTNTDEETYPRLLEGLFAGRRPFEEQVEVLNAGIPHATSSNIRAMVEEELLGYDPDVFTFYSGYNDAVLPVAETRVQELSRKLDEVSALYAVIRKLVNEMQWAALEHRWTGYQPSMAREQVELQVSLHDERYRDNLTRVLDLAAEHGVEVVLVRQPMTMWYEAEKRGQQRAREPYLAEHARIAAVLEESGGVQGFQSTMIVHRSLMEILERTAAERGLPLVDNVALLDQRLEGLVSKVHLDGEANRRLAEALYEPVRAALAAGD